MTTQDQILNDPRYKPVLDYGFVGLVDYMGDDRAIVNAARVSYGDGTKTVRDDVGLVRYLLRHKHTTPFEMVEFKFHCKMPIFVARQWIRHRTASVNEYSARYSQMSDECYVPEVGDIKPQAKDNKQGRSGELSLKDSLEVREFIKENNEHCHGNYTILLGDEDHGGYLSQDFEGIARELARMVMPLNSYTEWYWKIDLHNLFRFLHLRMDSHAQYEIRAYANEMYGLIRPLVPIAADAFEDYVLNAITFSIMELNCLSKILAGRSVDELETTSGMSKGEWREFKTKLNLITGKD